MKSRSERFDNRNKMKGNVNAGKVKVRKWEKKWVTIEGTSMKVFKWMPNTDAKPALAQLNLGAVKHTKGGKKSNTDNKGSPSSSGYSSLTPRRSLSFSGSSSGSEMQNEDSNLSFPDPSEFSQQASTSNGGVFPVHLGSGPLETPPDLNMLRNSEQTGPLKLKISLKRGLFNNVSCGER